MNKTNHLLLGIFLCTLAVRLFLAFTLPNFTYESYFHLRQVEHITETGLPLYHDQLSYGGREFIFLPLFHYVAAFFDLFLPLDFIAKLLPNLFFSFLTLIVYLIAQELGYSSRGSVFAAGIAGFLPALFTTNAFTPQSLFLPLLFLSVYAFFKIQQKKFLYLYFLAFLLASITNPMALLLLLGLGIYVLISLAEGFSLQKEEAEVLIASTFFYSWIQLLFFNDVLKEEGLGFIWQNIPSAILFEYFPKVSAVQATLAISIIPLIAGIFMLYRSLFAGKEQKIFFPIGITIATIVLTLLRLLPIKYALGFLGILFAIFFAQFHDYLFPFLQKTKLALTPQRGATLLVLLLIFSTATPAISTAFQQDLPTTEEIKAMEWLEIHTEEEARIAALVEEGHLITKIAQRKNIMDDQFNLVPDVEQRFAEVQALYLTPFQTEALSILEKYGVRYILVTPYALEKYQLKRLKYLTPECFHLVYHQDTIKIYERKCSLEKK